jgi:hypothetical protein
MITIDTLRDHILADINDERDRQLELFAADPRDAGCMRWGLCDTNGRSE